MKAKVLIRSAILFLLCNWSILRAQNVPIHWGVLVPEDVKMTVYQPDPEATAVVLCDYGTVSVSPRVQYTKHLRIKILKEAGLEYAKVEIPYRSYNEYDYFTELKAQTLNVSVNGAQSKTIVKSAKIEDVPIDQRHRKKVIIFQDVMPGSFIEYSYIIESIDIVKLNNWYFQSSIPVIWSEYRINIPRKLNYLVTFQQGRQLTMNEQQGYSARLQWLYNNQITKVYGEMGNQKNILYESPNKSVRVYLTCGESLRFVMDNMPAVKPKPYNTDMYPFVKAHLYLADGPFNDYFMTSLSAANEDYDTWDIWESRYRWRPEFEKYWLPTWEEATKQWLENEYLGFRTVQDFSSKGVLDAIAHTDSMNLIKGVYQFVKENVKWDGSYSMYAIHDFNEVLSKKTGSSGEMNLLLVNLLRKAGFKVTPVLIRTSDLGRVENLYPEKGQFNHVIAQVESNGNYYYLDATSDNSSAELPGNVEHTVGWLLKAEGFQWVDIENNAPAAPAPNKAPYGGEKVSPAGYKQI